MPGATWTTAEIRAFLILNLPQFEAAQAASKEASKAGVKKGAGETVALDVHDIAALEKNADVPKTDDSFKFRECLA